MPIYEYECARCGGFSESLPMSASGRPAACPSCSAAAPRVLSATAVGRGRQRRSRGLRDPILVKNSRDPPPPKAHVSHGDRPWMLGH